MKRGLNPRAFERILADLVDEEVACAHVCYQIGSTFVGMALMENSIISALTMCNRIQVSKTLPGDESALDEMIKKKEHLQGSTLGQLVKVLERHEVGGTDINYLRWVKEKRDFFVHRYFNHELWPGELDVDGAEIALRRLMYLEIVFRRAADRIYRVLERSGLLVVQEFDGEGFLAMNPDLLNDA